MADAIFVKNELLTAGTGESLTYGSLNFTTATAYAATGRKASQTWPDGSQASYRYDTNQNLQEIVLGAGSISVGQSIWNTPTSITYPGGSTRSQGYDAFMRLTAIQVKSPGQASLLDYRYGYDPESNITQKTTEHGIYAYGYDKLYRLTSASNPSPLSNESCPVRCPQQPAAPPKRAFFKELPDGRRFFQLPAASNFREIPPVRPVFANSPSVSRQHGGRSPGQPPARETCLPYRRPLPTCAAPARATGRPKR